MSTTTTTTKTTTMDFDVELFEQRLMNLKDTQEGIQQMSSWCLQQRVHHKKIVSSWLNVLKQVRIEHKLTLFYLANDVIQYSKRKNYEFVESWGTTLQKATTMVRDEKVRNKIFRIFKIWEQREIYSEEYLADLNGLLSMNPVKKQQPIQNTDSDEFQNSPIIKNIRDCVRLGSCTDKTFKNLPKAPLCDTETIKNTLKDRSHSEDVEREIGEFVSSLENCIKSLKAELKSRKSLITHLEQANTFYTDQRGEVKVVVNAYKNFGNRIKVVKKKLEEIMPNLPSPIPSPDINAPSPEQDADIILPDENHLSTNMFKNQTNGYTSYMDGNLPFDINDFKNESPRSTFDNLTNSATQPIQVISSRSEEKPNSFEHQDYYKPVMGNRPFQPSGVPQPVPPVTNYPMTPTSNDSYANDAVSYGSDAYDPMTAVYTSDSNYMGNTSNNNYDNNMSNMANMPLAPPPPMPPLLGAQNDDFNSTWDMDMTWTSLDTSGRFNHSMDTPVSPPHFEREGVNSNIVEYVENVNEVVLPVQDVDHRQLHIQPAICVKPPIVKDKGRFVDVDHRNLISLTGSPGAPKGSDRKNHDNRKHHWSPDKDSRSTKPGGDQDYRQCGDADYRHENTIRPPKDDTHPNNIPLLKPPPLPPPELEPPSFQKIDDFLKMIDTSMPPPTINKNDNNEGKNMIGSSTPLKGKGKSGNGSSKGGDANDNVENIDMEISDDDFEDFTDFEREELSNELEAESVDEVDPTVTTTTTEASESAEPEYDTEITQSKEDSNDSTPSKVPSPPPQPIFKAPLLETPPEFMNSPNPWDTPNHNMRPNQAFVNNNGGDNMQNMWNSPMNSGSNNNMQNPWKGPRMPIPGLGFPPGIPGNQNFPRGPLFPPQRNFGPQMRPNFRGPHMRPRGCGPYFNNRGRGGMPRGGPMGPRGNFRGNNPWH